MRDSVSQNIRQTEIQEDAPVFAKNKIKRIQSEVCAKLRQNIKTWTSVTSLTITHLFLLANILPASLASMGTHLSGLLKT